jgi:acyl-CoA synthetase (AMP-forming)/AMP-acid ligase II
MNAGNILTATATSYPEQTAWIWDGGMRTYGEANARADALAHALVAAGVGRGDRVALFLGNGPAYLETFFGVLKAGAAAVPLDSRSTIDELAYFVADSGAVALVIDAESADGVAERRADLASVATVIQAGGPPAGDHLDLEELVAKHGGQPFPAIDVDPAELGWLAYTGGTTGRSKGAMLTHGVLVAEAIVSLADLMRMEFEDVAMHAASLTHGSGYNMLSYTMKGCTQVILTRSGFDVERFLDWVPRYRVASLFMVPTMIKMVIDHPRARETDWSSLKWVVYGGSPMYVEDLKKALDIMGPVFSQLYGQTESPMTGTYLRREEHVTTGPLATRLGSCGRARSGTEIRIVDENDDPVPVGTAGEVCIRGATVMTGYWNRPDATAETLKGGWLHTGDVGMLDECGYLYLMDRTKDMVISGGLNIYPREIEELILTCPGVSEVCVFGVPDDKWGEALRAQVVRASGATVSEEEIRAFVGARLSGYKKPKVVEFVAEIPKTPLGKPDKKAARAPYWAGQDRMVR